MKKRLVKRTEGPLSRTPQTHHIVIYYDGESRQLYARPGITVAAVKDTIVIYAINVDLTLYPPDKNGNASLFRVFRFSGRSYRIKRGDNVRAVVSAKARPDIYEFRARSPLHKLDAVGGSYPKIIIYD